MSTFINNSCKQAQSITPLATLAICLGTGVGFGTSMGIAFDHLAVWLAIGVGLGGAIGGGFLIEKHRSRAIFMVLLLSISIVLALVLRQQEMAAPGPTIQVQVELQSGTDFSQDWPVYIYASAPGSKLPLSSERVLLSELPARVVLTADKYVLPAFTMHGHHELVVTAKVSSAEDVHKAGPEDLSVISPVLNVMDDKTESVNLVLSAQR